MNQNLITLSSKEALEIFDESLSNIINTENDYLQNHFMVEVTLQAQFFIGVIAFVVFSIFIIKTIKNISSINDDGDTIINLDKVSERKRKNK